MSEQLNHLDDRLKAGELTEEQYAEEKRRILLDAASRSQNFWRRLPEARRIKHDLIRGTVRSISFSNVAKNEATLDVDGRAVELKTYKESIRVSPGDSVLLAASRKEPQHSNVYYNESTGSNSLEESRGISRQIMKAGAIGVLAGLSILTTVGLAVFREPAFWSTWGIFHILLYVISIIGGGAATLLGIFFFVLGALIRKTRTLVETVISGR